LKLQIKSQQTKICIVVVLVAFTLTGCRGKTDVGQQPAVGATRVVTDDLGRTVTIPVKVTRVVSLAPNLTENIFAVGAGDRLVGVTTFCNYPEEAKAIAKIGDTMTPNMESIVALKPEVVFVSTASQIEAFMKTLEANGIAVYVTNPTSLDDLFKSLQQMGEIFGTSNQADALVIGLSGRESFVWHTIFQDRQRSNAKVEVPRVFVQISKEPLFTIGKQSFMTAIIARAGGESVTANVESAYPKLSKEAASALNPEAIVLSESDDNKEANEVFKNSPAVKNGRVYKINADLLSRPGPRLVDALEQIAKYLHPEKFN
jgi:iron complex transport system substrate-binding protein